MNKFVQMNPLHPHILKVLFNHLLHPIIADVEKYWDIAKENNLVGISINNHDTRFS